MKKILAIFCLVFFLVSITCLTVSAASAEIYDFNFNVNDVTFAVDGYKNYILCKNGINNSWYVVYFNDEDITSIEDVASSDSFRINFSNPSTYYRMSGTTSCSHLLFARYAGVIDMSICVYEGFPKTSTSIQVFQSSTYVITNSLQVSNYCVGKNIPVYNDYKIFYNNVNNKEYFVYSLSVSENSYIVSISTDSLKYNTQTGSVSASANVLYNFHFDTKEEAVNFITKGEASGLKKFNTGSLSSVDKFLYASTQIYDENGSVYFDITLIPSDEEAGEEEVKKTLNSTINDLRNRFKFIENLFLFSERLLDFFQKDHNTPPAIYADLSAAESEFGYIYGYERVSVLDFTWYQKYKPVGDLIISSFLWFGFIWRTFKNIPSLLNGGTMITEHINSERQAVESRDRAIEAQAEKEHRKSYEYYEEDRMRREKYSKYYNDKHFGGGG